MPTSYASVVFDLTIDLSGDDDQGQLETWTDQSLASEREGYGRSNLGFWLEAEDPADSISPFSIPVEKEQAYDGGMELSRAGHVFHLRCNGKFKVSVHKDVRAAIDAGVAFRLRSVVVNGGAQSVGSNVPGVISVSGKKL